MSLVYIILGIGFGWLATFIVKRIFDQNKAEESMPMGLDNESPVIGKEEGKDFGKFVSQMFTWGARIAVTAVLSALVSAILMFFGWIPTPVYVQPYMDQLHELIATPQEETQSYWPPSNATYRLLEEAGSYEGPHATNLNCEESEPDPTGIQMTFSDGITLRFLEVEGHGPILYRVPTNDEQPDYFSMLTDVGYDYGRYTISWCGNHFEVNESKQIEWIPERNLLAVVENHNPDEYYRVIETVQAGFEQYQYMDCESDNCTEVKYGIENHGGCRAVDSNDGSKMVDLFACGPFFDEEGFQDLDYTDIDYVEPTITDETSDRCSTESHLQNVRLFFREDKRIFLVSQPDGSVEIQYFAHSGVDGFYKTQILEIGQAANWGHESLLNCGNGLTYYMSFNIELEQPFGVAWDSLWWANNVQLLQSDKFVPTSTGTISSENGTVYTFEQFVDGTDTYQITATTAKGESVTFPAFVTTDLYTDFQVIQLTNGEVVLVYLTCGEGCYPETDMIAVFSTIDEAAQYRSDRP